VNRKSLRFALKRRLELTAPAQLVAMSAQLSVELRAGITTANSAYHGIQFALIQAESQLGGVAGLVMRGVPNVPSSGDRDRGGGLSGWYGR
jgi:hypothetical protein